MDEATKRFYEDKYGSIVRKHATIREETIRVFDVDLPALRRALKIADTDRTGRHQVRKIAKTIGRLALAADPTLTKMRVVDVDQEPQG